MGYKIKERRELLQMTQEELSEKSGISRQTISSIENGNQSNVMLSTLLKIAKALDTTVENIFF